MNFPKNRQRSSRICLAVLLAMLLTLLGGCKASKLVKVQPDQTPEPTYDGPVGYTAAAPCGTGFLACGTGGRVDQIAVDGSVTPCETGVNVNLHSIYVEDDHVLVAGDRGTLLLSEDAGQTFTQLDTDTDDDFYGAAAYNGTIYAAGTHGIIYRRSGNSWDAIQMESEHDIIGLVATNVALVAVTAETDTYFCEDGETWRYQNFNEYYEGMYPTYAFTRVIPAGETVFVLGYPEVQPNMPLIMYTCYGDVWMQKEMVSINGNPLTGMEDLRIHDICFNIDQIVGVMDGGELLSITNCARCNESTKLEEDNDLWATAVREEGVLVCGEDFFCKILSGKQIRQDKIQAEQAQMDIEAHGAVLIDVREIDELEADGYIPGSIHIPLAEVEARLPEVVPDPYTEVIFYCASGKRSQTATEKAVEMGYYEVYNLGSLSDWPYGIEYVNTENAEAGEEAAE